MKIAVTGAAGFIGANLCEYLLGQGHEVLGVDNFNDYYPVEIKEFNISSFKDNPNFTVHRFDISDLEAVNNFFNENSMDAVVHLVAWAGVTPSVRNPHIYAMANYVGTDNLAHAASKAGVKSFIFASTSSVYGNANQVPFIETMSTDMPAAPYPASKRGCEVLLYSYHLNYDLNVTIFRFFNPLGRYQRPDTALPKLIKSVLFGYEFIVTQNLKDNTARDYTYVIEMCKAVESAIKNPQAYEIFNLGNSHPETLLTLIQTVEEVAGKKVKIREELKPGQMEITFANIDKARKILGYNPSLSLRDMIKEYYNWFLVQPEWYQKLQINK